MDSNLWVRCCSFQSCGSLIDLVSTHVSVMPWLVGVVIVFANTFVRDHFLFLQFMDYNLWIPCCCFQSCCSFLHFVFTHFVLMLAFPYFSAFV